MQFAFINNKTLFIKLKIASVIYRPNQAPEPVLKIMFFVCLLFTKK